MSKPQPVFPAPGHDHARCTSDALAHAEAICAERRERLTPVRHRVLEALLASHAPLGAYELIDRLASRRHAAGADHGLSRTRFPARAGLRASHRKPQCIHRLRARARDGGAGRLSHLRAMRAVGEAAGAAVADSIRSASRAGFTPKTPVIEISGTCAHCKRAA